MEAEKRVFAMTFDKPYLSLEEVADHLGVTYQLIYRLVRSGELPAARLGRIYRVSTRDLEAYLEKSKEVIGAGICSACGKTYQSQASLRYACTVTGEPICVDCWERKGIRRSAAASTDEKPAKKKSI